MKIDSHLHFWTFDQERYFWVDKSIRKDFLPQDLKPVLQKNEMYGCIAVQAQQTEEENVALLGMANRYSFIKGVVGWTDLTSAKVGERLESYSRDSCFKGVRHTVWDKRGEFMTDPAFEKGIRSLGRLGLRYDILVFDYQLSEAVGMVRKFPDQQFVLNHMGRPRMSEKPSAEWVRNIKEMQECENVSCKISGLVTETGKSEWKNVNFAPYLDHVLDVFGIDRLMFGSDWPVCLSQARYKEVIGLVNQYFQAFSFAEKEKIFGGNASEFYNLKIERKYDDNFSEGN